MTISHLPGTKHKPQDNTEKDIHAVIMHSCSYLLTYNTHRKAIRTVHGLICQS